jgi:hypothetical protein
MKIRLRTRIEQLENCIMPESGSMLPLSVIRHLAAGNLSPSELMRWRPVIAQITAVANLAEEQDVNPGGNR